ncbi:hypothetical protein R6Q59_007360 [Mikania micrantha]
MERLELRNEEMECFYQQASMNRKSGEGDGHVLKKAMKDYKSVVKSKGFPHMQAWELVRYNSLWCDIPPVGCQSQSTTKRPKPNESMGSANAQINLDDDKDVEDEQQKAVDLEFMMKDHTIYQEPMLQLILDRKREIATRWGCHCPF